MKNEKLYNSGQALILVLLSLSVVLTIVLYVLSRSITDITTSTEQVDSVRAFSAAEAGVENALITGAGTSGTVAIGNATYSVDVTNSASSYFNYPIQMSSGDVTTVWFVSHKSDGSMTCDSDYPACYTGNELKVCWGNQGTSPSFDTTPAVEVSVYYETTPGDLSTVRIARATFDPNTTRTSINHFGSASAGPCTIGGTTYAFENTITLSDLGGVGFNNNGLLFAKVRMLYNESEAHSIGYSVSSGTLPPQGIEIDSVGNSGDTGSQSTRRIKVFQGWPEFPLIGSSIYTPAVGLTK